MPASRCSAASGSARSSRGRQVDGVRHAQRWDPEPEGWRRWKRALGEDGHDFQRIRATYLRRAAAALLVTGAAPGESRCITHPEFIERWENPRRHAEFHDALKPVKDLLHEFRPKENPIFWLRLVGYAHACNWFFGQVRADIGHEGIWQGVKRGKYKEKFEQTVKNSL